MNQLNQSISLLLEGGRTAFKSGEQLRGTICWNGLAATTRLELRLGWIIGDEQTHDTMCYATENYRIERSMGTKDFETKLPDGPHSLAGGLFKIEWLLEVQTSDGSCFAQIPIRITA